jgi:hypothetical protein
MIVKKLGRKIKTDDSQLTLKLFESGNEKDDKVKPMQERSLVLMANDQ